MSLRKFKFRESIVPDLSVKILDLCLNSDENGIAAPSTRRRAYSFEYGADQILKEVISKRIENHAKPVPLSQRKRSIYEQALKENTKKELKKVKIIMY